MIYLRDPLREDNTTSNHLPPTVRDALVRAAQTPASLGPLARVRAIEEATDRAKRACPDKFKNES